MKEILLTQGKVAIVDDDAYPILNRYKWCYNNGYAVRSVGPRDKRIKVLMHRAVAGTPVGLDTDHINGDKLDNRKSNLRATTRQQNLWNMRTQAVSGYKGVTQKTPTRWQAVFRQRYLGIFTSPEAAHAAYLEASKNDPYERQRTEE